MQFGIPSLLKAQFKKQFQFSQRSTSMWISKMKSTMIVILALVLALDNFNVVFGEPRYGRYGERLGKMVTSDTQVNKQENLCTSIAIDNFT